MRTLFAMRSTGNPVTPACVLLPGAVRPDPVRGRNRGPTGLSPPPSGDSACRGVVVHERAPSQAAAVAPRGGRAAARRAEQPPAPPTVRRAARRTGQASGGHAGSDIPAGGSSSADGSRTRAARPPAARHGDEQPAPGGRGRQPRARGGDRPEPAGGGRGPGRARPADRPGQETVHRLPALRQGRAGAAGCRPGAGDRDVLRSSPAHHRPGRHRLRRWSASQTSTRRAEAQKNVYYWADGTQMVATGGEAQPPDRHARRDPQEHAERGDLGRERELLDRLGRRPDGYRPRASSTWPRAARPRAARPSPSST